MVSWLRVPPNKLHRRRVGAISIEEQMAKISGLKGELIMHIASIVLFFSRNDWRNKILMLKLTDITKNTIINC